MKYYNRFLTSLKEVYKIAIPNSPIEIKLLFISLAWFLSFSLYFALNVDFSDMKELMGYDSFFYIGEDNPKLALNKIISWNLRHPIFVIINYPILLVDAITPNNLHVALFALVSSIITAFSNLFIFKICEHLEFDRLSNFISIALFSSFAHIILLSGQAETYVYTISFCLLLILLALRNASNTASNNIIFAVLTGTTITNCVFFFIIKFWEKAGNIKESLITTIKSTLLFIPLFAITFIGLAFRFFIKHIPLKDAILNDTYKFVHDDINLLDVTWKHYFAEPILFHYTDQVVLTQNAEVLPNYPFSIYNYIIFFILLFAFVWGGLFRLKTTISKICASFFVYNIIIHFICGYGNNELQLFCGHWIFFVPLLVAMGLNAIKSVLLRHSLQVLFLLISVFIAIHNGYCYITSINVCT